MSDTRDKLTPEQVGELLVPGEYVHTFINTSVGVLIGADMKRTELLQMAEQHGAELAGEQATGMQHGVVVWDRQQPIFCETVHKAG